MIKWAKQDKRFKTSCVCIAIVNIMKWRGEQVNVRRAIPLMHKLTKKRPGIGICFMKQVPKLLKHFTRDICFFVNNSYDKHIDIPFINNLLDCGNAVLLNYYREFEYPNFEEKYIQGHATLIIERNKDFYRCLNIEEGQVESWIPKTTLEKCIQFEKTNFLQNGKYYSAYPMLYVIPPASNLT